MNCNIDFGFGMISLYTKSLKAVCTWLMASVCSVLIKQACSVLMLKNSWQAIQLYCNVSAKKVTVGTQYLKGQYSPWDYLALVGAQC